MIREGEESVLTCSLDTIWGELFLRESQWLDIFDRTKFDRPCLVENLRPHESGASILPNCSNWIRSLRNCIQCVFPLEPILVQLFHQHIQFLNPLIIIIHQSEVPNHVMLPQIGGLYSWNSVNLEWVICGSQACSSWCITCGAFVLGAVHTFQLHLQNILVTHYRV